MHKMTAKILKLSSAKKHKKRDKLPISGLISIFSTDLEKSFSHNRREARHMCLRRVLAYI